MIQKLYLVMIQKPFTTKALHSLVHIVHMHNMDKDKDAFIGNYFLLYHYLLYSYGPKEFVYHMMTQTKDNLFHQGGLRSLNVSSRFLLLLLFWVVVVVVVVLLLYNLVCQSIALLWIENNV